MRKRKKTTSFKFKPFSRKQKKLLMWWADKSPYKDYDMIICYGSIRSGKTVAMIDSFITWSLAKHRHQNFILAGKSMGALKRNVLEPMFQILTAKGIDYHYHRSENPYVAIGSNIYYLFGANNESSQDTLQGLTAAGALADEAALFPRSFIDQMVGRCSAETGENGAKIFLNCNPAGPYHWFKTEYIDKAKEKKIFVLHFVMDDNLSLSEKVKMRFKRMFSGVFFKRYILGLWVMAEGIIYDMFREEDHVIDAWPIDIHDYQVTIDYGTKNPTAFILQGIHFEPDGEPTYYNLKEYYYDGRKSGIQKTDNQYYDDLAAFCKGYTTKVIIDPSAASLWDGVTAVSSILPQGVDHNVKVWEEDDNGGNSSIEKWTFRVTHNRPPVITLDTLPNLANKIPSDLVTIEGIAKDLEDDAFTLYGQINKTKPRTITVNPDGRWSFSFRLDALIEGENFVTITAIDDKDAVSTKQVKLPMKQSC